MPYFLVTLQADLGLSSNTQMRTFAVSEPPAKFWLRNARNLERTVLLHSVEVPYPIYKMAKELNPPSGTYYWLLSDKDSGNEGGDVEDDDLRGS